MNDQQQSVDPSPNKSWSPWHFVVTYSILCLTVIAVTFLCTDCQKTEYLGKQPNLIERK